MSKERFSVFLAQSESDQRKKTKACFFRAKKLSSVTNNNCMTKTILRVR